MGDQLTTYEVKGDSADVKVSGERGGCHPLDGFAHSRPSRPPESEWRSIAVSGFLTEVGEVASAVLPLPACPRESRATSLASAPSWGS